MNTSASMTGAFTVFPIPIFAKDLRILARYFLQIAIVLIFGGFLTEVIVIDILGKDEPDFRHNIYYANLVFGPIVFALVAGTVVMAEESENGTDWFLRRLPLSRARLLSEKLGAGVLALTLVYLLAALGAWLNPFNAPLDELDWLASHVKVAATVLSAYLFAVAASRYTSTVIASVLIAGVLEILMWIAYMQWDRWQAEQAVVEPLIRVAITFMALGASIAVLTGSFWQLRLSPALWRRYPGPALVWKGVAENGGLHGMAILLLSVELVHRLLINHGLSGVLDENALAIHVIVLLIASLTIAALGTLSYTREERDGVSAVLYHHPLSRSRLLTAKILSAVPALICLCVTIKLVNLGDQETTFTRMLVITGSTYSLALLVGQVLGGSIIPLLAVYPVAVFIGMALYDWLGMTGHRVLFSDKLPFADTVDLSSVLFLMIAFIGLYCLMAAWQLLTNVRFLTGSIRYRYAWFWGTVVVGFVVTSLFAQLLTVLL